MQLERSRVTEAAPVVSGHADDAEADIVFQGWRQSEAFQRDFNPYVELIEARSLRDRILHRFLLKPGHLVGAAGQRERSGKAMHELIYGLIRRHWSRDFVTRYLSVAIDRSYWDILRAETYRESALRT